MWSTTLVSLFALLPSATLAALDVDLESPESIRNAAKLVATDLMSYYQGNLPGHVPGILPGPPPDGDYYWWQGGALMGAMIDYWRWTGDDQWNDIVKQGIVHQAAPNRDFQDRNWTASLGNDDQAFWGMTALVAAENQFPDPAADEPQYLALGQAVYNEQAAPDRNDNECGGGLRWQVPELNKGYDYKNTIANGCHFNMAARLARYTGNETYADRATFIWNWILDHKYVNENWDVYDGAHVPDNCTIINKQQYSYNAAVLMLGAAHMYNFTQDETWKQRVEGLLDGIDRVFFPNGTAFEPFCELGFCTTDMLSFKGYVARWMATTGQIIPDLQTKIMGILKESTRAAVKQCTGGANGRMCGFHWSTGVYDGVTGAGQQMNVLGTLTALLTVDAPAPVTNKTGGTSQGDFNAGVDDASKDQFAPITTGDRAGAGIVTAIFLGTSLGGLVWMLL